MKGQLTRALLGAMMNLESIADVVETDMPPESEITPFCFKDLQNNTRE